MFESLINHKWWNYIDEDLRELFKQTVLLTNLIEKRISGQASESPEFHDYSFVVFPAAKAYEGFLKKFFFDMGFISDKAFYGKRFRIGKALNPFLEEKYRKFGVYDKLSEYCEGSDLPDVMWDTWVKGRNQLFHWFPKEKNAIDFQEAKEIINKIFETMDKTFNECDIPNNN